MRIFTASRHDLNVDPKQLEVDDQHLTAMVDVDYYKDMDAHLAEHFKPQAALGPRLGPSPNSTCE